MPESLFSGNSGFWDGESGWWNPRKGGNFSPGSSFILFKGGIFAGEMLVLFVWGWNYLTLGLLTLSEGG